jgi:hypothetical protein
VVAVLVGLRIRFVVKAEVTLFLLRLRQMVVVLVVQMVHNLP